MMQETEMRVKYSEVSCLESSKTADYTRDMAGNRFDSRTRYCDPALRFRLNTGFIKRPAFFVAHRNKKDLRSSR